jgi:hypothetical protein
LRQIVKPKTMGALRLWLDLYSSQAESCLVLVKG